MLLDAPPAETKVMPMPPRRPDAGSLAAPRPRLVLLPSASVLAFCAYALKMPICASLSWTCSSDERSQLRWACFSDSVAALEATKPLANCSTTLDCLSPWPLQAVFLATMTPSERDPHTAAPARRDSDSPRAPRSGRGHAADETVLFTYLPVRSPASNHEP